MSELFLGEVMVDGSVLAALRTLMPERCLAEGDVVCNLNYQVSFSAPGREAVFLRLEAMVDLVEEVGLCDASVRDARILLDGIRGDVATMLDFYRDVLDQVDRMEGLL